jgi:hypothetical protein
VPTEDIPIYLGFTAGTFVLASAGWFCWTGRWRGWTRSPSFHDPICPLGFPSFGGLFLFLAAMPLHGLGGEGPVATVGEVLGAVGLLSMIVGFVGVMLTLDPHGTYRRKPNGSVLTRFFFPRWYHEHLKARHGGGAGNEQRPAVGRG